MSENRETQTWRVLLTGATGFVGRRLYPALVDAGHDVLCATRSPDAARRRHPDRPWVELDVDRPETVASALETCDAAFYLIHQMLAGGDYKGRERKSARRFRDAAEARGIRRLVYLGGVEPKGGSSRHLESRLETGRVLRNGSLSTIELRASMIVGEGSASWKIVRDLAARLPAMILPAWTETKSQPVWIGDVVEALVGALEYESGESAYFNVPGPDTLTFREILEETSRLLGHRPWTVNVPLLTPRLSSYWLRFVTAVDMELARELVEGLKYDLVVEERSWWEETDGPGPCSFSEAARRELQPPESRSIRAVERAVQALSRAPVSEQGL